MKDNVPNETKIKLTKEKLANINYIDLFPLNILSKVILLSPILEHSSYSVLYEFT